MEIRIGTYVKEAPIDQFSSDYEKTTGLKFPPILWEWEDTEHLIVGYNEEGERIVQIEMDELVMLTAAMKALEERMKKEEKEKREEKPISFRGLTA